MTISVKSNLRLVPYEELRQESLTWYQDSELQWLVNGTREPLEQEAVEAMYQWQKENGDFYYIEYLSGLSWQTVGDVWLSQADFALVIASAFQQKQIGSALVEYFLDKLNEQGAKEMRVAKVYDWNDGSNALFTKLGFAEVRVADYYVAYVYSF